jgi:hypothetical protein
LGLLNFSLPLQQLGGPFNFLLSLANLNSGARIISLFSWLLVQFNELANILVPLADLQKGN